MNGAQRQRVQGIRKWAFMSQMPDWHNGDDLRFLIELAEEQDGLLQRAAGVVRDLNALVEEPELQRV